MSVSQKHKAGRIPPSGKRIVRQSSMHRCTMQGKGLDEIPTCAFGNATYVQTVTAQVSDAGNVTCTAPEWPLTISDTTNGREPGPLVQRTAVSKACSFVPTHTSLSSWVLNVAYPAGTAVSLNVSVGGCQYNFSYGYYSTPLVRRVRPECGPRYGSFPLTVDLEDSLDSLSHAKVLVVLEEHRHTLPVLSTAVCECTLLQMPRG